MNLRDLVPEDVANAQEKWELGRLLERGAANGRPRSRVYALLHITEDKGRNAGGAYLQNPLSPVDVYQRSLVDVLAIHDS
ncbi:MAG: hypothetical protein F2743_08450 [Actinobacteria bacterium]|nr:hypothetical protein [Actinomycetota bacterium]